MDEQQKNLIVDFTYKNLSKFGIDRDMSDDKKVAAVETILDEYPLTGPGGLRRMLGEIDPEYFCKAYLSDQFDREFGDYAREILNTLKVVIESNTREKQATVAPRGHGKSTFSSFAVPTWCACYEKKRFILFISANGDTAANFLEKVKKALESPAIVEDFGVLKGKVWNADNICTSTGVWIACTGWKSGIRGINKDTRPDLIALDDLEDKSVMESDSMAKKLEQCFNEEIGRLGDYKTDMFYIGTLLSEDSLLARTIKQSSWKTLFFKRVISFPDDEGEKLWEEWRKIYRDMSNENRFDDAWNFYQNNIDAMLKGVKVLWEDKVPADKTKYPGGYYNVMLDREAFGENSFWQEDQNEPRSSSDRPFKQLTYWQDLYEEYPKVTNLKLTIDPAEGKKQDNTSYTLGGKLNNGVCIKDGQLKDHKLNAIMEHTAWFIQTYPEIDEVLFEENTYKEDGTEQLRKYLVSKGLYRKVTGFRSTENKYNRILQMEPDINNGQVLFNKLNVQYNNEVLGFSPSCKHDDAPDGLHILWKRLKSPNFYIAFG